MSLFIIEDGGGYNKLDSRSRRLSWDWTIEDVNLAVMMHAKIHGSERTRAIIVEVTRTPYTSTIHIGPKHRGELIARLCRGMVTRPHMHVAHK